MLLLRSRQDQYISFTSAFEPRRPTWVGIGVKVWPPSCSQAANLDELHGQAQKYNAQLQEYNSKLQGELREAQAQVLDASLSHQRTGSVQEQIRLLFRLKNRIHGLLALTGISSHGGARHPGRGGCWAAGPAGRCAGRGPLFSGAGNMRHQSLEKEQQENDRLRQLLAGISC